LYTACSCSRTASLLQQKASPQRHGGGIHVVTGTSRLGEQNSIFRTRLRRHRDGIWIEATAGRGSIAQTIWGNSGFG